METLDVIEKIQPDDIRLSTEAPKIEFEYEPNLWTGWVALAELKNRSMGLPSLGMRARIRYGDAIFWQGILVEVETEPECPTCHAAAKKEIVLRSHKRELPENAIKAINDPKNTYVGEIEPWLLEDKRQ